MLADSVPASPVENAEGLWGQAGPFYDEPSIDDSMPMGHLLKSEPFEVIYNGIKPAHIRAWRTMYVTEDVAGNRVISTGVIMVPDDGRDACQTPFLPQHTLFTSEIPSADEPDFQHVFRDNSLGISNPTADPALRPPGKVLVTSCAADDSIMVVTPAQDARNLVDSYRAQGVDVHYHGLDCGPGVMITILYRWMTELFGMHAVN